MSATEALSYRSTRARVAASAARSELVALLELAERYPRSWGRERVMAEADLILDKALDEAEALAMKFNVLPKCVVCDDLGCEFCPKVI